jgi:multisubunit Na+/H+ antiporter MnhG subunit
MSGSALALRYRWLRNALSGNGLARLSDRLEAASILLAVAVAVIALPLAMQAGERSHSARAAAIAAQYERTHPVQAVAVSHSVVRAPRSQQNTVQAQWREGDRMRTTSVVSRTTVPQGAPVTVWLDNATGDPVDAPADPTDAAAVGMCVGAATWLGAAALGVLLAVLVRWVLNRSRARAWEREIRLLAHNDDGWANRHT